MEKNSEKIIEQSLRTSLNFFRLILTMLYSKEEELEKDFGEFFEKKEIKSMSRNDFIINLEDLIRLKNRKSEQIANRIVEVNDNYLKSKGYDLLNIDGMVRVIDKIEIPSMHDSGANAAMFLLSKFSRNIFTGREIDILTDMVNKESREIEEEKNTFLSKEEIEEIKKNISGTDFNAKATSYILEKLYFHTKEHNFEELSKKYDVKYDKETKEITIKRGLLLFFDKNFEEMEKEKKIAKEVIEMINDEMAKYNKFIDKHAYFYKSYLRQNNEIKSLKERLRKEQDVKLEYSKTVMNSKEDEDIVITIGKELREEKKENYYLKTRIEKLEEMIAILEEEKEENKELEENIVIEESEDKVNEIPQFSFIVIAGGRWNSKKQREVQELFGENNEVVFVDAEKTLRNLDKIKNADLIIFDTTYNSHKYYYTIKEQNKNIFHINNSSVSEVERIFA